MAAKSFADYGAEVIKVEPPRTGAPERLLGPFPTMSPIPQTGGVHLFLNTNKLGVTLDLENSRARDLLLRDARKRRYRFQSERSGGLRAARAALVHAYRCDFRS